MMTIGSKKVKSKKVSHCGGEAVRSWGFPPLATAERVSRHKANGEPKGQKIFFFYLLPFAFLTPLLPEFGFSNW